ncbi:hypothetical protein TWF718_010122 [Orbilia javanica]|uniref:Uncharacterized protein n=1 Tax=Orbilia javanica TaxID=47235 RepID=A0AAN8MQA5_9PEZI
MVWLKNAVSPYKHGRTKSSLSFFNSPRRPEISAPRIQTPFQNELPPIRPREIENVDKDSFDRHNDIVAESANKRSHLRQLSHENQAPYRILPNVAQSAPHTRPVREYHSYTFPQGSSVPGSLNTLPIQPTPPSPAPTPQEQYTRSAPVPQGAAAVNNEPRKDTNDILENPTPKKDIAAEQEENIVNTEPALLAKDPFFYERIRFHIDNAEDSFIKSDWDTALDHVQVAFDIFKGVDIFLMMREEEKFLLLQKLILCRCMSVLAARFYSNSVLHLSNQWNCLLKKEGLRDTKSKPWVDLVRILAFLNLGKYEEAQESCQKYLRPDFTKDDTNPETNTALNSYGFWLMAEILNRKGKHIEAKFYASKIPTDIDTCIYFNWVSHCLSPPEPQIQQVLKTVSLGVGPRVLERAAGHSWDSF